MSETEIAKVEFQAVDLDRHADLCLQFAADMDACKLWLRRHSLDDDGGEAGRRYVERMRDKTRRRSRKLSPCLARGADRRPNQPRAFRRTPPSATSACSTWSLNGVARPLQMQWKHLPQKRFVKCGFAVARLSVSPSNTRAIRFLPQARLERPRPAIRQAGAAQHGEKVSMMKEENWPEFGVRKPEQIYAPRPGAYAVISDAEGCVAVMRTPRGCYLPGGGSEGGETSEETLVREVREECGFDVSVVRRLGTAVEYVHTVGHDRGHP